ncbi:amino acid adenylation domain-containing protein [Actinokineospora sp. G85]|uniref:amino acid adenylation domain-containing protein n=1 Tax=Actinokineospora sp. G85 TaxID=3406626 RepID=UPI003C75A89E
MTSPGETGTPLSAAKQALLDRLLAGPGDEREVGVPRREPGSRAPLSPAQRRLWLAERMSPGDPAYNLPLGLRLRGDLDVAALRRALAAVVGRHEVLRSAFAEDADGTPRHRVRPVPGFPLPVEDVDADRVEEISRAEARAPFDLSTGPLLRARLLRTAEDDHFLLVTMHHLAADGWSGALVVRELDAAYRGERQAPAGLQFADYAAWQDQRLSGHALDRLLEHWRGRLSGAPPQLDLPTDRPRPAVRRLDGDEVAFTIPADLAAGVRALAAECGATPFAVLLAAFHTVLLRWTGQRDQVVGTPVAGRTRRELREVVGCFANTVALRTDVGGDPPFRRLVGRVHATAADALAHQHLPFERLVELLRPERDPGRHPVFQVVCTWQDGGMTEFALGDLAVEPVPVHTGTAKFDLQLALLRDGDEIAGRLEYATALFDRSTVERMAGHLATALRGAVEAPDRRLSELPVLTPGEVEALELWAGSGTARVDPPVVDQVAAHDPAAVAVVCRGEQATYGELTARASAVAAALRADGVGPETVVGVCLPRSVDLVVALLAVLAAGGAYLPLDPAAPGERLDYLLADTGATRVLTHRALADRFDAARALCLDEPIPNARAEARAEAEAPAPLPDNLAYLIHTSGSTGLPKAVQVSHRSMVDVLAHTRDLVGFGPADVLCAVGAITFDITIPELFLPLTTGARLVLATEDEARDGARLRDLLAEQGVTALFATPATWRVLLDAGWSGGLRLAVSAGEALSAGLDAELRAAVPEVRNMYGPTETTVWTVGHRTGPDDVVPIGSAVGSARLYVVDAHGSLAPQGVPGELWIGGAGVTRGYRGRPALTARRYVPDPFGGPGGRLYRTGDLVKWRADGTLAYLGRLDDQVKIRGFRVEPGEVEAALRRVEGVAEAVVVAERDAGSARLHAYVVPARDAGPLDAAGLRGALSAWLPEHLRPSRFTVLDALPLSRNGKVDRRALPAAGGRVLGATAFQAPDTGTARKVAQVWCEVLGVARVGLHDSFFDLGGHSMLIPRVQRGIEAAVGRAPSVVDLFQHPTVAALSAHLDGAVADTGDRTRQWARDRRAGRDRLRRRRAGRGEDGQ